MNKPNKADDWLDALATKVQSDGPQPLDLEGHPPMVLVPLEQYRQMEKRRPTLLELLRQMDWSDVDLTRDSRPAREVDF